MKNLSIALLLFVLSPTSDAQDAAVKGSRTISVSGTAEDSLPANEVTISVRIRTVNDDLAEAQKGSKAVFDKLLDDIAALGVPPEKVQLQDHELGKEYENGPNHERIWKGFYSSRSFMVVLDDVEKLELVHAQLAENPDLEVNGTSYARTDDIEIRKKLRKDALVAAREKAEAMTAVYGLKIGKVITIAEAGGLHTPAFPTAFETRNTGVSFNVEGSARGKVTLSTSVGVVFELVD